jgi:hypothetical protein
MVGAEFSSMNRIRLGMDLRWWVQERLALWCAYLGIFGVEYSRMLGFLVGFWSE